MKSLILGSNPHHCGRWLGHGEALLRRAEALLQGSAVTLPRVEVLLQRSGVLLLRFAVTLQGIEVLLPSLAVMLQGFEVTLRHTESVENPAKNAAQGCREVQDRPEIEIMSEHDKVFSGRPRHDLGVGCVRRADFTPVFGVDFIFSKATHPRRAEIHIDENFHRSLDQPWDFLFFRAPCRVSQRGANIFRREVGVKMENLRGVGT
jgi:hypothetical protein